MTAESLWRENISSGETTSRNCENIGQTARNPRLSGCLPTLAKVRHGVCVTSEDWIVHWSTLDSDSIWDHMCLDLDLENFTTIYTSKFFKKKEDMDDKAKRMLLDEVINGLGQKHDLENSDEWDLKMVDVNRYYDIMLGFANANTANSMNTAGYITVDTHSFGELIIP